MSQDRPIKPLIGVTGCRKEIDGHAVFSVARKYTLSVVEGCDAVPVLLPPLGDNRADGYFDIATIVARLDGLLVTGSPSNVEPHHYEGAASRPGTRHDPDRDATTLPLIQAALSDGLPLFAICRGIQELNVALGGTLHQNVQELPGKRDHRMPETTDPEVRYGPRHPVRLMPGGMLTGLAAAGGLHPEHIMVNSLHAQAIDRLAPRLAVEAVSDDGVIEAVRAVSAPAFALGVQWHPEYNVRENPFSATIYRAFGQACRHRLGSD